jgi:phytoene dehydrogenase-like protein
LPFDAVVVGGGHNGLVTAGYLAKAGLDTLVLERRPILGGCVTTEELPKLPGFKFNLGASDIVSILSTTILDDLQIRNELQLLTIDPQYFMPFPDSTSLYIWRSIEETQKSIAKVSRRDAENYSEFASTWTLIDDLLNQALTDTSGSIIDALKQIPEGVDVDELLRVFQSSPARLLEEWFDDDRVRALLLKLASDVGVDLRYPGLGFLSGEAVRRAHRRGITRAKGGSGKLIDILANKVTRLGGKIRTAAEVEQILVRDSQVEGVRIKGGEIIEARSVVSQVNARDTLLKMVGKEHIEKKLAKRLAGLKSTNGTGFVAHLALSEPVKFNPSLKPLTESNKASIHICTSTQHYYDHWNAFHRKEISAEPILSMNSPSTLDASLAPKGSHTLYIFTHVPPELSGGRRWDEQTKEEFLDICLNEAEEYVVNIRDATIGHYLESPLDLERRAGIPNGCDTHLNMTPDCLYSLRPLPELSKYRTPIKGLYLSGAGTHPGGGVTGLPGRNAALAVLEDFRPNS